MRRQVVAILVDGDIASCIVGYNQISGTLVTVTLKIDDDLVELIQVYAPDSSYHDDEYQALLDDLQICIDGVSGRSNVMGDFNARVGGDSNQNWPDVVGTFGLGQCNDMGRMLLQFCAINNLMVCNTIFKHKECRRAT